MYSEHFLYSTKHDISDKEFNEMCLEYNKGKVTDKEFYNNFNNFKEIYYWNKDKIAKKYCSNLWKKKLSKEEKEKYKNVKFNYMYVELEKENIKKLIKLEKNKILKKFFINSLYLLKQGNKIFYTDNI